MSDGGPLAGKRIAIICADRDAHAALAHEIQSGGGVALARAILGDVAGIAHQCAVIVVFADGYEPEPLAIRLDAIERWRDGPALIVVTDRRPASWSPRLERDRSAVVVESAEWKARLIVLAAPPTEPELPFMD